MGMAASQARLLCITARIHDVEYQAQSIQNAKTQLATLSDAAYQEYLRELEDTTLTISGFDGNGDECDSDADHHKMLPCHVCEAGILQELLQAFYNCIHCYLLCYGFPVGTGNDGALCNCYDCGSFEHRISFGYAD